MSVQPATAPLEPETGMRLALEGVTKQWRRGEPPVLDSVDLALPPAMLAVVVGRNGSGKTTLLRIAAGMIDCDAGSVTTAVSVRGSITRRDVQLKYVPRPVFMALASRVEPSGVEPSGVEPSLRTPV